VVKVAKSFHQNFFTPNQHTAIDKQLYCMFKKNKLFSFPIDARRIFAILNLWFAYNKLNRAYIVQQWLEASNILLRWHLISIVPTHVCQDILSVARLFIPSQWKAHPAIYICTYEFLTCFAMYLECVTCMHDGFANCFSVFSSWSYAPFLFFSWCFDYAPRKCKEDQWQFCWYTLKSVFWINLGDYAVNFQKLFCTADELWWVLTWYLTTHLVCRLLPSIWQLGI